MVGSEAVGLPGTLARPILLSCGDHLRLAWGSLQVPGDVLRRGETPTWPKLEEGRGRGHEAGEVGHHCVVVELDIPSIDHLAILQQLQITPPGLVACGIDHHVALQHLSALQLHALLGEFLGLSLLGGHLLHEGHLLVVQDAEVEAPAVEVLGQKASFGLRQHQVSDEPGHEDGQLVGEEEEEEAAKEEETFEASRGHRGIPQEPIGSPEEPGELLVALLLEGANHVAAGLAASHHEHLQVLLDDLLHDVFLELAGVQELPLEALHGNLRPGRLGREGREDHEAVGPLLHFGPVALHEEVGLLRLGVVADLLNPAVQVDHLLELHLLGKALQVFPHRPGIQLLAQALLRHALERKGLALEGHQIREHGAVYLQAVVAHVRCPSAAH
mmetsp:Transcript_7056/g.16864  ORF Transcript_7056/g.16864 Transcript_7056/m.16864 type:complete len:386 (+) Transcript_7056:356-1513(+)